MSELEYTEQGWRLTADTSRHHRERSWDYRGRGIYHLTLVVAERYPLFGKLKGDSAEQATVELSDFGREVWRLIRTTPQYYAHKEGYNLKILAGQIMPDHAHVVLQVVEPIPQPIGQVIRGIKAPARLHINEFIPRLPPRSRMSAKRTKFQKITPIPMIVSCILLASLRAEVAYGNPKSRITMSAYSTRKVN